MNKAVVVLPRKVFDEIETTLNNLKQAAQNGSVNIAPHYLNICVALSLCEYANIYGTYCDELPTVDVFIQDFNSWTKYKVAELQRNL